MRVALALGAVLFAVLLLSLFRADPPARAATATYRVYLPAVFGRPLIPPDDLSKEETIVRLINEQRNRHSLSSLVVVSEMIQAARRHSRDMADNDFTGHQGSDGTWPWDRLTQAGYTGTYRGENVGWGFAGNTSRMVDWWMNSPGHRAAILDAEANEIGVGYAYNASSYWDHYWTVEFGKR